MTKDLKRFNDAFRNIKRRYDAQPGRPVDLVCKQGSYGGCAVLKLQKPAWTNDSMRKVPNQTGIFFSVWIDSADAKLNRAKYNIHALRLRELKSYRLTSNAFAKDFRAAFKRHRDAWPNVSTAFGSLTLMQGWIEIDATRFERDVLALLNRFKNLCPVVDELLIPRATI